MKRYFPLTLIACVFLAVFSFSAEAGVPSTISYRGRLVDASGAPVADGVNFIRFVIYDSPTAGTEMWNSGIQEVPTSGGLFTYQLGSNTPLPAGLFDGTPTLYLGIKIGADPEITPRTMFTSSAFAHHARRADTATIAQNAILLDGEPASAYLDWNSLTNVPAGFIDGVDNEGSGDITEVNVGAGLTGGGVSGPVEISIATGGITAAHIADGSIGAADINASQVQRRVSGSVAAGQAIRAINIDGTVTAVAVGNGDITAVTATGGLSGGGTSGAVTVQVATNGINAAHIASGAVGTSEVAFNSLTAADLATGSVGASEIFDGSITNVEISSFAGIATSKISGTAVNLSSTQTITGAKTFTGLVKIADSVFTANANGIKIGAGGVPSTSELIRLQRSYNTTSFHRGLWIGPLVNKGTGGITGLRLEIGTNPAQASGLMAGIVVQSGSHDAVAASGRCFGILSEALNSASSTNDRFGVNARGGSTANTGGSHTDSTAWDSGEQVLRLMEFMVQ